MQDAAQVHRETSVEFRTGEDAVHAAWVSEKHLNKRSPAALIASNPAARDNRDSRAEICSRRN